MPRFLLDQNLSPRTTNFLREEINLNVTDVREVDLLGASDDVIYAFATIEGYILMTYDTDFARLYQRERGLPGLVLLRFESQAVETVHPILRDFFSRVELDKLQGATTVVERGRYRISQID